MRRRFQFQLGVLALVLAGMCGLALPGLHFADGPSGQSRDGSSAGDPYDVVIHNARVMDPETHRDETGLNIGIRGKTIRAITHGTLKGRLEIDAAGRVAAPGFIDILSYNPIWKLKNDQKSDILINLNF